MSIIDDIETGGTLVTFGLAAIIVYFAYRWFSGASTCILKTGQIPGITGATAAQANAAKDAGAQLKSGGRVIWSDPNSTDYDYQQPSGDVVQARSSFWGQLTGTPVVYTTIPAASYTFPSYGNILAAQCCYSQPASVVPVW